MAANLIPLTVKLVGGAPPKTGTNEVQGFSPVRFIKIDPSAGGPDGTDADIVTRILYNEGTPNAIEYHVEDTVAEVIALANAVVTAV